METVIEDYADVLARYVVPWLDRFPTCRDVVDTDLQKRWGIWLPDTPTKSKQAIEIGLCALAAEMVEPARTYLEFAQREYRKFLRPESSAWFREDLRLVEEYLDLLSRNDWEAIRARLAEGEAYTRKEIGLPPP
ncbi:MAG: hypothetical protein HY675_03715 [Chloroflexi bacterium]|nr:hypothetical protein [Chloroflexota bacterium]